MKILITGVNGFVGKELYKHLEVKHEVFGIFRSGECPMRNCYKSDLTDESACIRVFKEKLSKLDLIIHLAGRTASASNASDTSVLSENVSIAKNIATLAKSAEIKHFINFSSSSVYPNVTGVFDESSVIDPSPNSDCIYGLSKYNSEILLKYMFAGTGIHLTNLRVAMIHGEGMDKTRLIPVFENELKEKNSITVFGDGERYINQISTEKLKVYLDHFIANPVNDTINVAEETITLLELAKRIMAQQGRSDSKLILKPEGNRNKFKLNTSKLKSLLDQQQNA
jgi:nucleoside-diphosphate-sugar epimerase